MSKDAVQEMRFKSGDLLHERRMTRQGKLLKVVNSNPKVLERTLNLALFIWIQNDCRQYAKNAQ